MYLLCSPEFVPQILGGVDPPGFVTLNESVKHCVAVDTAFPIALGYKVQMYRMVSNTLKYL